MRPTCTTALLLLLAIGVTGCGDTAPGNQAALETASRTLSPQDGSLADIYDRSCRSCHTIAATGAPLTGDGAAWATRLDKGMNTLVDNVIYGFGGMPPLGMCMDCSPEDFEALIVFMAASE